MENLKIVPSKKNCTSQAMPKVPRYFGRWLRLEAAISLLIKLEVLIISAVSQKFDYPSVEMPFVLVDLPNIVMYNRFVR